MSTQNTQDLINYYANLLILQYIGKPKAYAHIQTLVTPVVMPQVSVQTVGLSAVPASGTFKLSYNGVLTGTLNWNDSAATIQTALQTISGLASITVAGSLASQLLTLTFTGVTPPALLLSISANTLANSSGNLITPTLVEIDEILPLAVQDAFNLLGSNTAVGVQLDIIGKYVGVTRTGTGFHGNPVTLDDADFFSLIQMAVIQNSSGSSLSQIQKLLNQIFPGEVLVFDYQNMQMSYLISSAVGSQNLVELFVSEGLLPKPMAVSLALVIYSPDITHFFGFRTYQLPGFNVEPFNTYASYQTNWPWLSYADAIVV